MTLPEKELWKALRKPDIGFRRQDGGWHDFPEAQLHDALRDEWLIAQGYRVLRFRNRQALDDPSAIVVAVRTLLPQGEKGWDEGVLAEFSMKDAETPPALFLRFPALTLTQPSPFEGEGLAIEEEGAFGPDGSGGS
jgi:hypothetical protein